MLIDNNNIAHLARLQTGRPQEFGFAFLLPLIGGAVASLFQGQTAPVAPVAPPKPWWQTTNGMIGIGAAGVAVIGIGWLAFGGKSGSTEHKRRRRRSR